MGAYINKVELISPGYDFELDNNSRNEVIEWDFLLGSVSFDQVLSPVPLPAAVPMFMSALLGGFVAARRYKSSDNKVL